MSKHFLFTLNTDYSSLSETPISRTKSFKKSLRESFRRIRKGRASGRHHDKHGSKSSLSPISPPGPDRKRVGYVHFLKYRGGE